MNTEPCWEDMGEGALPPAREQGPANPLGRGSPVVCLVKCMAHPAGCREQVEVTQFALDGIAVFDRFLAKRGEAPLDINATFPCASCARVRAEEALKRSDVRRTRTTEAIRYLKNIHLDDVNRAHEYARAGRAHERTSDTVLKATERVAWLGKVHGDGYVSDLVNHLRDKARSGGKSTPRKGDV